MIYRYVGPSLFAGLFAMGLAVPIAAWLARKQSASEDGTLKEKDDRVKIMNEVLQGIKAVKYFVWEEKFVKLIMDTRAKEYVHLRSAMLIMSVQDLVSQLTSIIGAVATFTVYAATGGELNSTLVFSTLTLFNILSWYVTFMSII